MAKGLIALLGGLTPSFKKQILSIQKSAADPQAATWGELESKPDKLWANLEPVFKLRGDIVRWVYDNLTVRAVQDALAAISAAIDKLVYMVLRIFLGPLLSEFSKILKDQEQELLIQNQQARQGAGESSIFDGDSTNTNHTHSQLAEYHYDNKLNEIAGRVAVRISSYTVTEIVQLWQPGNATDPRPALDRILEVFQHPFRQSPNSTVQTLMYTEVSNYINN